MFVTLLFFGLFVFAYAQEERMRPDRGFDRLTASGSRIPGQYIVVLKDSVADVDAAESDLLGRTRGEVINSYRSALRGFSAHLPDDALAAVKSDPRVEFVSEDYAVSINDSDRRGLSSFAHSSPSTLAVQSLPTGVNRIDAENLTNTGAGVDVAVIDTGIFYVHPDLKNKVVGGKNCTTSSGGYLDQNGHGTHVAGTIAALNNGEGVVGVAPGVNLWSVRVLDRYGSGSWSSVICGLDYVTSKAPKNGGPIKVANMSLGGGGVSDNNCGLSNNDALHRAICRARDAGVTIVVAAGNSGASATGFVPAAYDDAVITVSALVDTDGKPGGLGVPNYYGADDTFATFSNWGTPVDIGAPGVNIYSTWLNNGYNTISGTSMASPHVAGAAALYVASHPGSSWAVVRDALRSAGEPLGAGHTDPSGRHPEPVLQANTL